MPRYQIDDTDRKILSFLVRDARMAYLEIARECGVSGAAIHQRIKRLEKQGIVIGSRLLVEPEALGLNVCAFVQIALVEGNKMMEVKEELTKIPELVECHFVTGKYTFLIKLYCRDNEHLMNIVTEKLLKIPYIQSTETLLSLQAVIDRNINCPDAD